MSIKVLADYHTHTTYSHFNHGKGSVLENALQAQKLGLQEIAITDHGFNHFMYGIKRREIPSLRADIEKAEQVTGVHIYLGIEANLISSKGDIDIKQKDLEYVDFIIMGYHKIARAKNIREWFHFILPNMFYKRAKKRKGKIINMNTKSYILALQKYPIDIISHLNHEARVDCGQVAQMCAKTNTYLELNGKRRHFNQDDVDAMLKTSVQFVLNSDAHTPDRIADNQVGEMVANKYGIPYDRIVNINGLIKVKNKKDFVI